MLQKTAAPAGATNTCMLILAPALLALPPETAAVLYLYAALLGGLIV